MTDGKNSVIVPAMKKLLATFLLIALPLAWTTAAVAAYCKHETVPAEQNHIGHHADRDHGSSTIPDPENSDGTSKPHAHCSMSHSYCSAFPVSNHALRDLPFPTHVTWLSDSSLFSSLFPDEPERPKWPVVA